MQFSIHTEQAHATRLRRLRSNLKNRRQKANQSFRSERNGLNDCRNNCERNENVSNMKTLSEGQQCLIQYSINSISQKNLKQKKQQHEVFAIFLYTSKLHKKIMNYITIFIESEKNISQSCRS